MEEFCVARDRGQGADEEIQREGQIAFSSVRSTNCEREVGRLRKRNIGIFRYAEGVTYYSPGLRREPLPWVVIAPFVYPNGVKVTMQPFQG